METIIALIEDSCRKFGDRTAFLQKAGGVWRETPYGELRTASDRIAAGLMRSGFQPGDRAALLAPSSPQWVMVYIGILKAGGVVVPIDKDLKSIEVRHILGHSESQALFVDGDRLEIVLGMADEMPSLRRIITFDSPGEAPSAERCGRGPSISPRSRVRCTVFPLHELLHPEECSTVQRRPNDPALILYTSGTTGRSKGAMLSHANIVSNIRGVIAHLEVDQSVHTLSFLPINHVFEQVCGILLPLSLGGKVSFCESLKKLGENLAEVKPTFFVGVPAVFRMMLGRIMKKIEEDAVSRFLFTFPLTRPLLASRVRRKLGSGTVFISGGAALDSEISRQFAKLGITIFQGYGITETSPVISAECRKWRQPGTVGRVMAGVEVRIDNPDDEMVGEIQVRGPNVMQGYFKDPDATAEVLADGWYRTGDLGRLDDDGLLSICGRARNLIVTPNGRNVYPEEVENEILKSAFIAEVVVYANRTDPVWEEIHAMIYPSREALEEHAGKLGKATFSGAEIESLIRAEVSSACERLAPYKRVKKFTIRKEEFPKTTTRKIKRFEVEAPADRRSA
ncbi:MAG: AMP-dependent synthetase and [Geobacteraceae bacterium]|nr:MAG: AMP-dependent synthetase and [Geobacteraceae bacterium]